MTDPGLGRVTIDRWRALWAGMFHLPASGRTGSDLKHDALYHQIVTAYGEAHRAYHDLTHLEHCLEQLDAHRDAAAAAGEIEMALWFHDAVYRPIASDNEEQSARWARSAILEADRSALPAAVALAERVAALILATRHDTVPVDVDARLMVDVDLSILGSPAEQYDRYEVAVRREYRWVPRFLFRKKRLEILKSFLRRDAIFQTEPFHELYESRARSNLTRVVAKWR